MKINQHIKNQILYFLLSFVLITLPFPNYSFNSKTIVVLAVFWIFYSPISEKATILRRNKNQFLIFLSIFLIYFFSLLVSSDIISNFHFIGKKISIILLPLIILTIRIDNNILNELLKYFSLSVIIASLLALLKALYFKFYDLGDYLSYSNFAQFLEKHTTYFALFTIISILYFTNNYLKTKNKLILFILVYLSFLLYILSVRISIIALLINISILFYYKGFSLKYLLLFVSIVAVLFFLSPNFQKRFASYQLSNNDITYRFKQWNVIINEVSSENFLLGLDINDRAQIYNSYKNNNLTNAYKEKYNAHNQFIEMYIYFGFIGVFIFFSLVILMLRMLFKKDIFYFTLLLIFTIFMLTESILERHSGIILFVILVPLLIHTDNNKNIANE